jgi:hypothetical protein
MDQIHAAHRNGEIRGLTLLAPFLKYKKWGINLLGSPRDIEADEK